MYKKIRIGICICVTLFLAGAVYKRAMMQQHIAEEVIRFHVIANSDRQEDQITKLEVRDIVLRKLEVLLKDCETIEETRSTIKENLSVLETCASEYVRSKGISQEVHAKLATAYFPAKVYADYTFPAGAYQALKITIGKGKGHNWWSMVYPRLCMQAYGKVYVSKDGAKKLHEVLTEEEYEWVTQTGEVKLASRLLEWIREH